MPTPLSRRYAAVGLGLLIQAALAAPVASADEQPSAEALAQFSLEQLSQLEVTSVSKTA